MQKVTITVTNDLATDQRIHRMACTLAGMGLDVLLVGRKQKNSPPLPGTYKSKRMQLIFNRGPLFYAEYNIRLFLFLLTHKGDIYLSNDLDTLPACYIASRLTGKKLVFDSHEYFPEVPELVNRPVVKFIWEKIEGWIVPKLKHAMTVSDSIATVYLTRYGTEFVTLRNLPVYRNKPEKNQETLDLGIPDNAYVIVYQGVLNKGRGLEKLIQAMQYLENHVLLLIGDGDIRKDLADQVHQLNLQEKVIFTGRIPMDQLIQYTRYGDMGVSLESDLGLNYRYALPNKLFAYIQAELPVYVSGLPEMASIVHKYDIGLVNKKHDPLQFAMDIRIICEDQPKRERWKKNLKLAARELCWENEEKKLMALFQNALS